MAVFQYQDNLSVFENGKYCFNCYLDIFNNIPDNNIGEQSKLSAETVIREEIIQPSDLEEFRQGFIKGWEDFKNGNVK